MWCENWCFYSLSDLNFKAHQTHLKLDMKMFAGSETGTSLVSSGCLSDTIPIGISR